MNPIVQAVSIRETNVLSWKSADRREPLRSDPECIKVLVGVSSAEQE